MQYSIQIFCQETISFLFEIEFVYNYVFCSRNKASGAVELAPVASTSTAN